MGESAADACLASARWAGEQYASLRLQGKLRGELVVLQRQADVGLQRPHNFIDAFQVFQSDWRDLTAVDVARQVLRAQVIDEPSSVEPGVAAKPQAGGPELVGVQPW